VTYAIHPREEWIGSVPWDHTVNGNGKFYVCPSFRGWDAITDVVIHYPGADWADLDFNNDGLVDLDDTKFIIQKMHVAYLMGERGYSLGYGYAIGTLGDIWEIRGQRNTNAANLGDVAHGHVGWNNYSISVLIIVDNQDAANAAQVAACNWLLDEFEKQKDNALLKLKYHGMGQSTSCAGTGIINQIKAGTIAFGKSQPPVPQPKPPSQGDDDDMATTLFRPANCRAQFIGQTDKHGNTPTLVWVDGQRANAYLANGCLTDDRKDFSGFVNCVLLGPLPTGDDMHQWTGAEFFRVVT
jgi:hypothetical protein